jgi:hypothetical protein
LEQWRDLADFDLHDPIERRDRGRGFEQSGEIWAKYCGVDAVAAPSKTTGDRHEKLGHARLRAAFSSNPETKPSAGQDLAGDRFVRNRRSQLAGEVMDPKMGPVGAQFLGGNGRVATLGVMCIAVKKPSH